MNGPSADKNHDQGLDWAEARSRVEAYLKALCLVNPQQQERIVSMVLAQARARHARNPTEKPVAVAMTTLRESSDQWFKHCLPSQEHVSRPALLSLYALDAQKEWPEAYLSDPVPPALENGLQRCDIRAGPDISLARMVPQPLETPLREAMQLPTALTELTRNLSPSLVAKAAAFLFSGFSLWWTKR